MSTLLHPPVACGEICRKVYLNIFIWLFSIEIYFVIFQRCSLYFLRSSTPVPKEDIYLNPKYLLFVLHKSLNLSLLLSYLKVSQNLKKLSFLDTLIVTCNYLFTSLALCSKPEPVVYVCGVYLTYFQSWLFSLAILPIMTSKESLTLRARVRSWWLLPLKRCTNIIYYVLIGYIEAY